MRRQISVLIFRSGTKFLLLVVMGAPTEHWIHAGGRRNAPVNTTLNINEQWPYSFKLTGTVPENSIVH